LGLIKEFKYKPYSNRNNFNRIGHDPIESNKDRWKCFAVFGEIADFIQMQCPKTACSSTTPALNMELALIGSVLKR
jgi:hypothetical protein